MPQVLNKNFCKHSFHLWHMNENLSDLIKILNPSKSELSEINSHKTLKRRKQNICSRILLNLISNKKTILRYDEFGKPFCENFKFISISHSDNFCGIVTSNENIGLDIQKKKTNIEKLSSRFVSPGERLVKFNNEIDKIHYIWCFKESIYFGSLLKKLIRNSQTYLLLPNSQNNIEMKSRINYISVTLFIQKYCYFSS